VALLTDPTEVRRAGETAVAPSSPSGASQYMAPPSGYSPTAWTNLIGGNSGYMNWALSAAERKDIAGSNRKAALQALAIRYGGLPSGFKDVYGDITEDVLGQARANPLSESSRLGKSYTDSVEAYKRQLAARNALQSGELGYGLGQIDYQRSADTYDLGQQFMDAAQGAVNQYGDALSGLSAEQIAAIRQAASDVYGQGYRLGTGGGVGGDYLDEIGGKATGVNGAGNFFNATDPGQLDVSGGWGVRWEGPGRYEARKFGGDPGQPAGNTVWVKVGELEGPQPTPETVTPPTPTYLAAVTPSVRTALTAASPTVSPTRPKFGME
jgi:hypothetical protein